MTFNSNWLYTRNNWNINPSFSSNLYKIKILLIIKKHLSYNIICSSIYFFL